MKDSSKCQNSPELSARTQLPLHILKLITLDVLYQVVVG